MVKFIYPSPWLDRHRTLKQPSISCKLVIKLELVKQVKWVCKTVKTDKTGKTYEIGKTGKTGRKRKTVKMDITKTIIGKQVKLYG